MSFDINPPSRNLSNVQASAGSCPGGGGNTGYFNRRGAKEEPELKFAKNYPEDSFEMVDFEEEKDESFVDFIKGLFKSFVDKIKNLFKRKKSAN